jgi:hypothetical protein
VYIRFFITGHSKTTTKIDSSKQSTQAMAAAVAGPDSAPAAGRWLLKQPRLLQCSWHWERLLLLVVAAQREAAAQQ